MSRKIAILTSGGDCGGLNAVMRAAVFRAAKEDIDILGIHDGTAGLLRNPIDFEPLDASMFDGNVLRRGGTILGTTNKGNPFSYPMPDGKIIDRSQEIIDSLKKLDVEALIGIGGDGSQAILRKLAIKGDFKLITVPKTIDNDVCMTDFSVGFDTAVATATEALDRLQPTAASHDRVMILEVMGRDAGHIALHAGISGGADVILIPEIPYNLKKLAKKIRSIYKSGRNSALVIVSEAIKTESGNPMQHEFTDGQKRYGGAGHYLCDKISELTGAETRATVLGHVQRGSPPTHQDRLLASCFGVKAVELILEGKSDRMVAWQGRNIVDVPIKDAIKDYQDVNINGPLVKTARGLGISFAANS